MENNPSRKDIADRLAFSGHISNVDDFWSHEPWSATPYKQVIFFMGIGSQAEIADGYFPRISSFEEYVFRLKVSMDDLMLGEMTESS